jgi:hypothetical protein
MDSEDDEFLLFGDLDFESSADDVNTQTKSGNLPTALCGCHGTPSCCIP